MPVNFIDNVPNWLITAASGAGGALVFYGVMKERFKNLVKVVEDHTTALKAMDKKIIESCQNLSLIKLQVSGLENWKDHLESQGGAVVENKHDILCGKTQEAFCTGLENLEKLMTSKFSDLSNQINKK